jgi:3-hydroxymyristoyl/3-hydroxydecanoyl-(acyl carrier protein) dehydratase
MIIQEFEFHIRDPAGPIYDGVTQFGFFSDESLLRQVGIRNAVQRMYLPSAAQRAAAQAFSLDDVRPWTPDDSVTEPWFGAAMPARAFRMVDTVDLHLPDGGPHGLGCIQGSTTVDPGAWFFKAHFYQDPVWPGSLGLESFLQLLKAYARHRWPQMTRTHRFETIATGREHTWAYRGQIIPTNKRVEIAAEINKRDDGDAPIVVADGFLSVDGIPIYEMRKFGMRLVRV